MAISFYYVHNFLIFKTENPFAVLVICNVTELYSVFIFWSYLLRQFAAIVSSYPLQSTLKSVGFPLLSRLKATDVLVISNNHSKNGTLNGLEFLY